MHPLFFAGLSTAVLGLLGVCNAAEQWKVDSIAIDCAKSFNVPRIASGISPFPEISTTTTTTTTTAATMPSVPEPSPEGEEDDVQIGGKSGSSDKITPRGICNAVSIQQVFDKKTVAFTLPSTSKPTCEQVTELWGRAFNKIGNTAPPKYTATELIYQDMNNINFIAMMNPATNASVTCEVYTCTESTDASSEEAEAKSGLYCEVTPAALKNNEAPFTEDQWSKITTHYSAAATAIPAVGITTMIVLVLLSLAA